MKQRTTVRTALCIAALMAALCGCGGGSDATTGTNANPNGGNTGGTPETIQGIATPSSVSVVTATNAQ